MSQTFNAGYKAGVMTSTSKVSVYMCRRRERSLEYKTKLRMAVTICTGLCTLAVVLCAVGGWTLVEATCSSRTSNQYSSSSNSNAIPPSSPPDSLPGCHQMSQREMQTSYLKCFMDSRFQMSLNVAVDDYGILASRANEILDSNEFVNSFDQLLNDNCLSDSLQPKNKYWKYVCDYDLGRIPQISWSVECHTEQNPCRQKTITCACSENQEGQMETNTCSDGVPRKLDCTGACSELENSCEATYSIAQQWKEVNVTTVFLELEGSTELLDRCKVTPMELYQSNRWRLRRQKVTVACTCEEQQPVQVLSG